MHVTAPTSIQTLSLPSLIHTPQNHFLAAQTGTGKTLAYLLPFFHRYLTQEQKYTGLVVTFSRELVAQMEDVLKELNREIGLKHAEIYGGQKTEEWKKVLRNKPELICGTIDKVVNLAKTGELSLDGVRELVVDECDTLVDAGKTQEIEQLLSSVRQQPTTRVTLVSATVPRPLEALLDNYFSKEPNQPLPYLHRIIDPKAHFNLAHLQHEFILLPDYTAEPVFLRLLADIDPKLNANSGVVFCNSIPSVMKVCDLMGKNGYPAVCLHGKTSSKERFRNYKSFKSLEKKWLVCTDLGSRGLDFPAVSHVIQYDFPKTISDYLHRAGRAGRCYREGTVHTLYKKHHEGFMQQLQNSFHTGVPLNITTSAFS